MTHDIFICYDETDEKVAFDVCKYLEENGFSCWLKKRDFNEKDTVLKISESIRSSKSFVLIYSDNARQSNFVATDTDIAFSSNVPIVVFKIDDASIDGKMQFYLEDKPLIEAEGNPEAKRAELLDYISKMADKSAKPKTEVISKSNEVYICHAEEDSQVANAICHVLEENNIKCWLKSRDLGINDSMNTVIQVIKESKCFVLIFSENSENSGFVKTDIDIAASTGIPILSFNIDQNMDHEAISNNVHWLDAFPSPEDKFSDLIVNTSKLLGKPIKDPKITKKYNLEQIPLKPKKSKEPSPKVEDKQSKPGILDKISKKALLAVIAILLVVGVAGVFLMSTGNVVEDASTGVASSGDGIISIDSATFDNDTNTEYSWNYSTFVWFNVNNKPANFDEYTIKADYYDESGNLVDTATKKVTECYDKEYGYSFDAFLDVYTPKIDITVFDENGNEVYHSTVEDK